MPCTFEADTIWLAHGLRGQTMEEFACKMERYKGCMTRGVQGLFH